MGRYEETTRVTCAVDVTRRECHQRGCCWNNRGAKCYKNHDMCVNRRCGEEHWQELKCNNHGCCWSRSRHGCFHHRFVSIASSAGSSFSGGNSGSSSFPFWLLVLLLIFLILLVIAACWFLVMFFVRRARSKGKGKNQKKGGMRDLNLTPGAGQVVTTQASFSAQATPVPIVQAIVAE
eukprot:NODE_3520_length_775_cov_253.730556.p3 GENE.NODE_3520_length_775_cov_253.730556~~NODE_3520_length_775_cov_253.730556.p3  ORF type:complete len:178 (+),score=56.32 NODE_3520_length_775_cov_253.730556:66-599(+)